MNNTNGNGTGIWAKNRPGKWDWDKIWAGKWGFISLPLSGKKKLDTDHYYFCPHLLDWEFAVYFGLVLFTSTMGFGCHPIIELTVDYGTLP